MVTLVLKKGLHFELPHPATKVMEYLSNPDKFTKAHPLIEKMEPLGEGRYTVYEKIKLGPYNYAYTYKATIKEDLGKGTVNMKITIKKISRISLEFNILPDAKGCRIEEIIHIQTPFPIRGLMMEFFEDHHILLFENINQELHAEK